MTFGAEGGGSRPAHCHNVPPPPLGEQEVGSGSERLPSLLATPSRGALTCFLVPSLTDALEGSCWAFKEVHSSPPAVDMVPRFPNWTGRRLQR